jgi:hypothetical protein
MLLLLLDGPLGWWRVARGPSRFGRFAAARAGLPASTVILRYDRHTPAQLARLLVRALK